MNKDINIGAARIDEEPKTPLSLTLRDGCVTNSKLAENAVSSTKIQDKAVTPEKVSDNFVSEVVLPPIDLVDQKTQRQISDLYTLIKSYNKGGIALSNYLGDSEEFGITQKTISRYFKKVFDKLSEITGEEYTSFTMTVEPTYAVTEGDLEVTIHLKMDQTIFQFDTISIYVNNELKVTDKNLEDFTTTVIIDNTSVIKAEVVIAGDTYIREETVTKFTPFFIGAGQQYSDIVNEEHRIDYEGSISGSYDVTVENNNEHIIVIIPLSAEIQYKRIDMNGFEIPFTKEVTSEFIAYTSANTYNAGTYNIDIEVNN